MFARIRPQSVYDSAKLGEELLSYVDQLVAEQVGKVFTPPELSHLRTIMRDASDRGEYYGNKEQYWKRHERILQKLQSGEQGEDKVKGEGK